MVKGLATQTGLVPVERRVISPSIKSLVFLGLPASQFTRGRGALKGFRDCGKGFSLEAGRSRR